MLLNNLPPSEMNQMAFGFGPGADRLNSWGEYEFFASRNNNNGFPRIFILLDGGGATCDFLPLGGIGIFSGIPIPLQEFVHLVCQFGPSGIQIYFNENLVRNLDEVISFPTFDGFSEIGWNSYEDFNYFFGVMDEMTIYNRSLGATEIQNSFRGHERLTRE